MPVSFMPGLTGSIYRQFALTICFAVLISSVNSLSLSPALAAILIKKSPEGSQKFFLFRWFDIFFDKTTDIYFSIVHFLIKIRYLVMLMFFGLLFGTWYLFTITPTGFVPEEDKGVLMVMLTLQPGSSIEKTKVVRKEFEEILLNIPGI